MLFQKPFQRLQLIFKADYSYNPAGGALPNHSNGVLPRSPYLIIVRKFEVGIHIIE